MSERNSIDSRTLEHAERVLSDSANKRPGRGILPFLGPAFIASVAYVDPGNFATNIEGGSRFGYLLLWVIVVSNLMAMIVQTLSAKLGIATGLNLAEVCREKFSRPVTIFLWLVAEAVVMATDLAEFVGAALGFHMLFGFSLPLGAVITAFLTFVILGLERYGFRPMEIAISVFLGIIALCYIIEIFYQPPQLTEVFYHTFVPGFQGTESILLAAGILGATMMPHVIYLHSALTQGRIVTRDESKLKRLFKYEVIDVVVALGIAGLVNAAMLMMAATTFHGAGLSEVTSIEDAYKTLEPLLGKAASAIFAISLLASGLSSCAVGTMAGQVVMKGFLRRTVPLWFRRSITMLPSIIVIWLGLDPTKTLVISQVILSFGIPFALVPLVYFTSQRRFMGVLVNRIITTSVAWCVSLLIIALNIFLLFRLFLSDSL